MTDANALTRGIDALGVAISEPARQKLVEYLALIEKWNRVYNLTAVRDPEKMVTQHLLDSLAVVPHLSGETLLDVGTGAGLPGVPIALARPEMRVSLLESSHKKSAFLTQVVNELGLANVEVIHSRVESTDGGRAYDVVISRAFSDLAEFVTLAGRFVRPGGVLAAMKGVYPYEEIDQLPAAYQIKRTVALEVPGLEAERHLVLIEPR